MTGWFLPTACCWRMTVVRLHVGDEDVGDTDGAVGCW